MSLGGFSQTGTGITLSSETGRQVASELTLLDSYKIQNDILTSKINYLKNILSNKDSIILKLNTQITNQKNISMKKDYKIENYQEINAILEQEKQSYKSSSNLWRTISIVLGVILGATFIF